MESPTFSIIVPAYNEEGELPSTVAALRRAMDGVPWAGEIIVVDNNSSDATARVAEELGVRVIFEPVNQIARARNAGGRVAAGRWLVFVDADTRITPGLLRQALAELDGGQVCGGGALVTFEKEVPFWARNTARFWNWISAHMGLAAGCFFYCLRSAWADTGGFDERVFVGEELWFSRALKRWGRPRGQRVRILPAGGISTSARKMDWYPQWRVGLMLFVMMLYPRAARSRRFCWFWYRRPKV